MKTIKKNQCQCHHCNHAATAQCSRLEDEDRVRLLINAASAARAGTAQMTLNDWREVELEVKERLQNDRDLFRSSLNAVPVCRRRVADRDRFPAMDASDQGGEYLLEFDFPGLKLEDIHIGRDDAVLYLNGQRKTLRHGGNNLRAERPAGAFVRRIVLPADTCGDEIHATLQNGVLELHIPRKLPPDENGKSHINLIEEPHYERTTC